MDMEMEREISCVREASWTQSQGSLDTTVIFITENPPDGPEIESRPLILTPPSDSPCPCEITLKFEGSPCEVSSIYVRSTARIFELYNKSEINADNEYVCTARGDFVTQDDDQNSVNVCTPHGVLSAHNDDHNVVNVCTAHGELYTQNDDNNSVGGTIIKDDSSSFVEDSCTGTNSYSSTSSPIEIGTQTFLTLEECDGESSVYQSQSDSNNENSDETLQNVSPEDSIRVSVEIPKSESHCSDDDSWVDVKLSGLLVENPLGKSGSMSGFESSDSKDHFEGKAFKQLGISATNNEKEISEHNSIDVSQEQLKSTEGSFFHKNTTEEKSSSIRVSNPLTECKVEMKTRSDRNSVVLSINSSPKKALYEATVEIVNATPCVSLTIRFLSLQDKSFVEIDTICIYGQGISVAKDGSETIGLSSSSLQGSPFGGSLLAMLIPSMLQMSKGGLNQCRDGSLYNFSRDKSIPQMESSEAGSLRSSHPPNSPLSLKEVEASRVGNLSSYTVSGKVVSAQLPVLQEKATLCLDNVGDNLELKNNLSKSIQNMRSSVVTRDNACLSGRQNELRSENSYMSEMIGAQNNISSGMDGPYNEEPEKQYSHEDVESNMIDIFSCKKINGENMLEHICKRMDRLEALCMQIDDYVHRSFNTMERRLQLIESFFMMQNHTVMTKMENGTIHSDLPVVSNSLLSSSVSRMETQNNGNLKHISAVDTPRTRLVSSSDCSPSCTIVNPTTLLSDFSCTGAPKDLKSDNIDLLQCVEETSSNDDFDKSLNLKLDDSAFRSLDQQDLLEEEHFGNKDSLSVEHIEEYAGTEVSINAIGEQPTTTNKSKLSLEEALASALSAFSTSVRPVQLETCTFTETPSSSSQTEYSYENECFNDTFLSSQMETTGLCTRVPSGPVEPSASSSDDEQNSYHDDTVNSFQGVRYISQESMDSATYSCSQGIQDVKQIVYKGRKISDSQGGLAFTIGQSCCAGTETVFNVEKEIMLLENENEHELHANEMILNKNVFDAIQIKQTTIICEDEVNTVHDCQEQFQPLQGCYDVEYSEFLPKPTKLIFGEDQKMVVDETYSFNLSPGNSKIQVSETEGTITGLEIREKGEDVIVASDSFTEPDEHAPRNMDIDLSSFLDVSFAASSTLQTDLSLESLLYDYTPEHGRETISVQKTIEAEPLNSTEPKHPHELFFVEDEGLGDLITPGTSTLISSVTPWNTSNQGIIPELSLGFESLL